MLSTYWARYSCHEVHFFDFPRRVTSSIFLQIFELEEEAPIFFFLSIHQVWYFPGFLLISRSLGSSSWSSTSPSEFSLKQKVPKLYILFPSYCAARHLLVWLLALGQPFSCSFGSFSTSTSTVVIISTIMLLYSLFYKADFLPAFKISEFFLGYRNL